MRSFFFLIGMLGAAGLGASCGLQATDCNLTSVFCSCDRRSASEYPDCRDYEAVSTDDAKAACSKAEGTFSTAGLCPTDTRVGTCKFTAGTDVTYQRYYLANFSTAVSAAAACTYFHANCFAISGNIACSGEWTSDI